MVSLTNIIDRLEKINKAPLQDVIGNPGILQELDAIIKDIHQEREQIKGIFKV